NELWKLNAEVEVRIFKRDGNHEAFKKLFEFDNSTTKKEFGYNDMPDITFSDLLAPESVYRLNDQLMMEIHIDMYSLTFPKDPIIIRFDIDNVMAGRLSASSEGVESNVVNEGGFKWSAVIEARDSSVGHVALFTLRCAPDQQDTNEPWNCVALVEVRVSKNDGTLVSNMKRFNFYNGRAQDNFGYLPKQPAIPWNFLNPHSVVELHIYIFSSDR
ncbi:hypothetical protein PMAYCL1PPCAC_21529, partial [Pristionchus mayeri]